MNILVVEDDPFLGPLMVSLLTTERHTARWASSVDDAQKAACDDRYDAILLDLVLGPSTGDALVRGLSREGCRIPPIIVVSGESEEILRDAQRRVGAFAVCRKPCTSGKLRQLLADVEQVGRSGPRSASN